jgi:hypothetical protein
MLSSVVENCRRGVVPPASPPPPVARVSAVSIHVTQRSTTSVGAVGVSLANQNSSTCTVCGEIWEWTSWKRKRRG